MLRIFILLFFTIPIYSQADLSGYIFSNQTMTYEISNATWKLSIHDPVTRSISNVRMVIGYRDSKLTNINNIEFTILTPSNQVCPYLLVYNTTNGTKSFVNVVGSSRLQSKFLVFELMTMMSNTNNYLDYTNTKMTNTNTVDLTAQEEEYTTEY